MLDEIVKTSLAEGIRQASNQVGRQVVKGSRFTVMQARERERAIVENAVYFPKRGIYLCQPCQLFDNR